MTVADSVVQIWDVRTGKPLTEPMQHERPVASATFSRDGKWVMTIANDGSALIWDAQTGKAIGQPLGFGMPASFSTDAKWVFTDLRTDRKACLWDAATFAAEAPPWLAELAEAVSDLEISPRGALEPSQRDSKAVLQTLRKLVGADDLSRFGRWFVADPSERAISPRSPITVPEFVSQRLRENTSGSVEEAYRIDPGNPLIVASLAKFEKDKDEALCLCRYALRRTRIEGPPEKIEQVRSIAKSVFPDLPEFSDATNAPSLNNR